jgi:C4-dicarboxylate-specific signal transduction histidine kinase
VTTFDSLLLAGVIVFALQAGIIAALLVERRLRRRAESQNRAILSSMAADLALVTRSGVVETCNDNWARSVGSQNPFMSAAVGRPWIPAAQDVPAENQGDLMRLRQALDEVLGGRDDEQIVEYAWQTGSQRRWSHVRLRRLERAGGGAVVAHVDITPRKRMEAENQNTLHELAHMNMRAGMGELVSVVTHEINQPLTASLGNAQALRRMLSNATPSNADLMPIIEDIIDANRRAADVIGRIRTVMRKEEFEMQPLDFNAIVAEIIRMLNPSAAHEGIVMAADLDPALPQIPGDRVQLRQVAMNLIVNAVQATRSRGGAPPIVRVKTSVHNGGVALMVEDAGDGVPDDALSRLFEPYFTTKQEGLGVGLSITRSIVESHGGSIEVANLPEGGARFSVILPAH